MKLQLNKKLVILATLTTAVLSFQNCSEVAFAPSEENLLLVCDPLDTNGGTICDGGQPENGLVGEIYYFLNKNTGSEIPDNVYDKFDNAIAFPNGITNVEQYYTNAFKLPATLLLSKLEVPTLKFDVGFIDSNNQLLTDENGRSLFEAFAIRVNSLLKLPANLPEGQYEFALLSDDGSILEIDSDNNGQLETIVDNDGLHSTRLGCSVDTIELKHDQLYPMRVKYHQGPRVHIALTLLMRKVDNPTTRRPDALCGLTSSSEFYGADPAATENYVPDLVDSKFGDLTRRGWFVPQNEMFILPR